MCVLGLPNKSELLDLEYLQAQQPSHLCWWHTRAIYDIRMRIKGARYLWEGLFVEVISQSPSSIVSIKEFIILRHTMLVCILGDCTHAVNPIMYTHVEWCTKQHMSRGLGSGFIPLRTPGRNLLCGNTSAWSPISASPVLYLLSSTSLFPSYLLPPAVRPLGFDASLLQQPDKPSENQRNE